jgi:uncharacterized protein (DUF697 family)
MDEIVRSASTTIAHAAGWSILPFLDWLWVGPIWRDMMRSLVQVRPVILSTALIEECVDRYKAYGRSWGTVAKFLPVLGPVGAGIETATVSDMKTKWFGHACIDSLLEFGIHETVDDERFKARLEHHLAEGGGHQII